MADLRDLLLRRAGRGEERGIDEVCARAFRALDDDPGSERRAIWPGRLVAGAVAAAIAAGLVSLTAVLGDDNKARVSTSSQAPQVWRATAPAPVAGRFAAATATDGRRMFVWGGLDGSKQAPFADGALYDPGADTWEVLPPAPAPLHGLGKAVWDGSRFLVLSPMDTDTPVALAAYAPARRDWQLLAPPPLGARDGFTATWTGTELIAASGGAGDTIADQFGASYDPVNDRWQLLAPPPYEHYVVSAAAWSGDSVVFAGGAASAGGTSVNPQANVPGATFVPGASSPWSALPTGPVRAPRWAFAARGGVAVFGIDPTDKANVQGAVYNPGAHSWTRLPATRAAHAVLEVVDGAGDGWVVVTEAGGLRVTDRSVTELPSRDLSDRAGASIVAVNGRLVVWGGLRDTGTVDTALDDGMVLARTSR